MDVGEKRHADTLRMWLATKPTAWAQAIALRAALRALPSIAEAQQSWLRSFALLPFGALVSSWIQITEPEIFVLTDETRSNARFGGISFQFDHYKSESIALFAAQASYHSADAQSRSMLAISDCIEAVISAANALRYNERTINFALGMSTGADTIFWDNIYTDCKIIDEIDIKDPLEFLFVNRLWDPFSKALTDSLSRRLKAKLLNIDPNYSVWIDWFERRIRGERAAFDIPGDKYRQEDKAILRRLAEATNEDFWGKGHEYVNATLKAWLDEARARAAANAAPDPPAGTEAPVPPQDAGAIAYGINAEGKL
ncbi:hypothetical protein, partial [Sphingomonas sp.]|uniref:hypothetical protein n=1 Tax=Sphingomonas sp. TaxID=28214 RepID=UPI001E0D2629